jgi:SLAP domain-containing protein
MDDKLVFDPAWEKAIAPQDREAIKILHHQNPVVYGEVRWTPIRVAMNHQNSLLAMVLIQNGLTKDFTAEGINLTYIEKDRGVIAKSAFNLPNVRIRTGFSMPWTFVFPEHAIVKRPLLNQWHIELL